MKNNMLLILMFITTVMTAQDKMITKTGKITFEASVPAFEEVKAKNESATCVLNSRTGEIATLALIKGFRFKIALMEEHFNENYLESDKYPKATFKGKIDNFDVQSLTTSATEFNVKGKLEIHGKTRDISTILKIKKTDAGIDIVSNFSVNADDYAIAIPSVVKSKVSNKVIIKSEFTVK